MNENEQLDLTLLNGYLESLGAPVVEKMLAMYEQQSLIYIKAIESAKAENDTQAWYESCHKMKGAASSAGLVNIYKLLVVMEKNTTDLTLQQDQLIELKQLNIIDVLAFKMWLSEKL